MCISSTVKYWKQAVPFSRQLQETKLMMLRRRAGFVQQQAGNSDVDCNCKWYLDLARKMTSFCFFEKVFVL